jgi:uncharacterized protein (TIGR02145 family)
MKTYSCFQFLNSQDNFTLDEIGKEKYIHLFMNRTKKTLSNLFIIIILSFIVLVANGQDYSAPMLTNTRVTARKIITLDDVFNITEVSPQAQTILPDLSHEERSLIDPDAVPSIIGVVRTLSDPFVIKPNHSKAPDNYLQKNDEVNLNDSIIILTSSIKSENANALRVKLMSTNKLTSNIKIFVYSISGEIYGPYHANMFSKNYVWSHMIFHNEIFIQIQIPYHNLLEISDYIIISEIAHFDLSSFIKNSCLEDVNCAEANSFSYIEHLRSSVAGVATFGNNTPGTAIWCSGVLLANNNYNQQYQPLFQTVAHCIPDFQAAYNATFFFDYKTTSCWTGQANFMQVNRATELFSIWDPGGAFHSIEDYSLLLLMENPSRVGRVYMGWNANDQVQNGTTVHNVSHPMDTDWTTHMQRYTRATKASTTVLQRCGQGVSRFDYIKYNTGTTRGRSSGSPWVINSGQVVGAHAGKCGNPYWNNNYHECDYDDFHGIYARLYHYYPYVEQWLQGTAPANIAIAPASHNFGNVNVNSTTDKNFYIQNNSNSGFNLDIWLGLSGTNANQFSLIEPSNNELYIPPGGEETVTVRFNPNCGGSMNASLTLYHNATNISSPHNITLSGCAIPAQPGNISGPTTVCSGTQYTYSISSVCGATSYNWEYSGGGTPSGTGTSVTLVPTSSGTLKVRSVNTCGSSNWRESPITVTTPPSQPDAISGETSVCGPDYIYTYSVSSVPGATSYQWTLPSGWSGSSTTNSINVNTGANGGTISVIAVNSCGNSSPRSKSVSVTSGPAQPGSITGPSEVCQGDNHTYSISPVSGATYYHWSLPSGWSGSSNTTSINVTVGSSSGNVRVKSCNDVCGCGIWRSKYVEVSAIPSQPGTISGKTNPCTNAQETYSVSNVSGVSYSWSFPPGWTQIGGGNSNSVTVITSSNSGIISVTPSNYCGSGPPRNINVTTQAATPPAQPGPISGPAGVESGNTYTYTISPVPEATSYSWSYSGQGSISGSGLSIQLTPTTGGTLNVFAVNVCGNSLPRTLSIIICGSQISDIQGNTYNTVLIDNQCWMKENLKTTQYRNGTPIPQDLMNDDVGGYTWYENNISWKDIYGALYNKAAITNSHGLWLCPTGWHVPSLTEWEILIYNLGGSSVAGGPLKGTRTEPDTHPRWNQPNTGATNSSGFSAYPGGFYIHYNSPEFSQGFHNIGKSARWWTSTQYNFFTSYNKAVVFDAALVFSAFSFINFLDGYSVRCISDGSQACLAPQDLNSSNVTAVGATINWTQPVIDNQWDIIYGFSGFNPENDGTLISGVSKPYTLTGLEPSTDYDVYVRAVCEAGFMSEWAGPVSFITLAPEPELSVDPTYLSFEDILINSCSTLSYQLTGINLTDNVIIHAPPGFQVSTNETSGFEDMITVPHTNGSVDQTIYVRFCPDEVGEYSGEITNVSMGALTMLVNLFGIGASNCIPPEDFQVITLANNYVQLTWQPPILSCIMNRQQTIVGYEIYRNGNLITTANFDQFSYLDGPLINGIYNYSIKTICNDSESLLCGLTYVTLNSGPSSVPFMLEVSSLHINSFDELCFNANATIFASDITVKNNGSVFFIAGGSIIFTPSILVEHGGYMHARIGGLICEDDWDFKERNTTFTPKNKLPSKYNSSFFSLFPNPTPGTFTILLKEAEEETAIMVEIYSMIGERILQTQLSGQQQYEFDLSNRPGGVYLVRVVRGEEVGLEKVVKQ